MLKKHVIFLGMLKTTFAALFIYFERYTTIKKFVVRFFFLLFIYEGEISHFIQQGLIKIVFIKCYLFIHSFDYSFVYSFIHFYIY